jgi:hypothetical protein
MNRIKNFSWGGGADAPEYYNAFAWDYPLTTTKIFRIPPASIVKRASVIGRLDANGNTGVSFGINGYYFADCIFDLDTEGFNTALATAVLLQNGYNCDLSLNDKNSGSAGYAAHDLEGFTDSRLHKSFGESAGFGLLFKTSVRSHIEHARHTHQSGATSRMTKLYYISDVTFDVLEGHGATSVGSTGVMIGGASRDVSGRVVRAHANAAQGFLTSTEGLDGLRIDDLDVRGNNIATGASDMYLGTSDKNIRLTNPKFDSHQGGATNVSYKGLRPPVVTTTDGTVTSLKELPHASTAYITAHIWGHQTNGVDECAYYIISGIFNPAGTLGTALDKTVVHEDVAGWDATIDFNAGAIRVRVTGAAGDTVAWSCSIEYESVTAA